MYAGTAPADPRVTQQPAQQHAAFANDFVMKDFTKLNAYLHSDYIQHNPLVPQGSAGFREFFEAWFKASPDFTHEVKQLAVDQDRVWVFGTYGGTQTGDWLGIPATGKRYSFDAIDIFRIQDGKLAEYGDVLDIYSLFQQLGAKV